MGFNPYIYNYIYNYIYINIFDHLFKKQIFLHTYGITIANISSTVCRVSWATGAGGGQLSGGQKQRIAIARALVNLGITCRALVR